VTRADSSLSERDLQIARAWLDRSGIADAGPPPSEMYRVMVEAEQRLGSSADAIRDAVEGPRFSQ
jgi:hypothetical protein